MDISYSLSAAGRGLGLNTAEATKIMKQIGFDGVDFQFCSMTTKEVAASEKGYGYFLNQYKEVEASGLKVCQSHLHYLPGDFFGDGLYNKFESDYLGAYINEIKMCGEMGCPTTVIHLYFEDSKKATVEGNIIMLNKLLPYLEKYNVALAMENVFAGGEAYADCHYTTSDDIMEYVDKMNHPLIGVCLDTGHAIVTHQDPVQMIKAFGKHLIALHMNGNAGRDMHLLPGTLDSWLDTNDYEKISLTLKEVGYKGPYNLEIGCGNWPNKPMSGIHYLQLVYDVASGFAKLAE